MYMLLPLLKFHFMHHKNNIIRGTFDVTQKQTFENKSSLERKWNHWFVKDGIIYLTYS